MGVFQWSLLLALPLEVLAGSSLYRVMVRAEPYVGAEASGGGYGAMGVLGTFGSGVGNWAAGYFGTVHEAEDNVIAAFWIPAACSQLLASMCLVRLNNRIRAAFEEQQGQ